ncbi:MAG: heavy metal translocating P-type ATPase [Alphaproteobacteria bacterium]
MTDMTSHAYKIEGMHCASCAAIIEKTLAKIPGVARAEVNYATSGAKVEFDGGQTGPKAMEAAIAPLGYHLVVEKTEKTANDTAAEPDMPPEVAALRGNVIAVMPLAAISIFIMTWEMLGEANPSFAMSATIKYFFHHLLPVMATYALFAVGKPYLAGVYRFIRYGAANMDTLIGLGTGVAYIYSFIVTAFEESLRPYINVEHNYYDAAIVVIAFITLGKYLEARARLKTGYAIRQLLDLQAKTARVLRQGVETEIPVEQVLVGDVIVVKPGAKLPVDGIVLEGSSHIDESMITGEPDPAAKKPGDTVTGGTINGTGSFTFRATKVGADTMLAAIVRMVENAQNSKAPIQALADKIAGIFVPIVLVLALLSFAGWLIFGIPALGFAQAFSYAVTAMVSVLVIACPCALGLATPTAIIVGVGKGAREGILIKDAATLERLQKADIIVFDKTGTITKGKPELVNIKNFTAQKDEAYLLAILAALENKSEHPLAHAIMVYAAAHGITPSTVEDFAAIEGKGIKGKIGGAEYFAGNAKLMEDLHLAVEEDAIAAGTRQGKTPVFLATHEKILGVFLIADTVRPEAAAAIVNLKRLGMTPVMLTGDDGNTARHIASQVGISEVVAEVLPQGKLAKIQELKSQGHIVAMAGDGINDAPALAEADIGIAMGTGSDIAIETAGLTLLNGDLTKLVKAARLSRMVMRGVKQNLFWAFIYNLAGIPLAAGVFYPLFGSMLSPAFAGIAMAFSSVSVVANSLRLKAMRL